MHKLHKHMAIAAILLAALVLPSIASATVITFTGSVEEFGPGNPTVESGYRYDALSGTLIRSVRGNPNPSIEGRFNTTGGILQIVRDDLAGGLFTFDGADIAKDNFGIGRFIVIAGYRNGVLQASESFQSSASDLVFTTISSIALSGVLIDELQIGLEALDSQSEIVDNVVLTASSVPEPSTIAMLGLGLAGFGYRKSLKTS